MNKLNVQLLKTLKCMLSHEHEFPNVFLFFSCFYQGIRIRVEDLEDRSALLSP